MKPGLLFLNVIRINQGTLGPPGMCRVKERGRACIPFHSLGRGTFSNLLKSLSLEGLLCCCGPHPPNTPHTPMLDPAVPSTHITSPLEPTLTHCCSRSCHHLLHCIKDPRCQEFYFCAEASEGQWLLALPGTGQAFGKRILNWRGKEGFCWESGVQSFHCR